jgi:hypothetical protein
MELFNIMCKDDISTPEKIEQLKHELASFFNNPQFLKCQTMGDVVKLNLKQTLLKNLLLIQQAKRNKAR